MNHMFATLRILLLHPEPFRPHGYRTPSGGSCGRRGGYWSRSHVMARGGMCMRCTRRRWNASARARATRRRGRSLHHGWQWCRGWCSWATRQRMLTDAGYRGHKLPLLQRLNFESDSNGAWRIVRPHWCLLSAHAITHVLPLDLHQGHGRLALASACWGQCFMRQSGR